MKRTVIVFGFALFFMLIGLEVHGYEKPEAVSQEIWDMMQPLFLPEKHPLKSKLDRIFKNGRPSANYEAMKKAGFKDQKVGPISLTTVAKHSGLKKHLVKLLTDDVFYPEYGILKKRVEASKSVRKAITELGYESYFVVPQKWIYPLPANSISTDPVAIQKYFIILEEKMDILSNSMNHKFWKNRIDKKLLTALCHLISLEGLFDSVLPRNIPFTKSGKIALIDLEHHLEWPIPFYKLDPYLNAEMGNFWKKLYGAF